MKDCKTQEKKKRKTERNEKGLKQKQQNVTKKKNFWKIDTKVVRNKEKHFGIKKTTFW